MTLRLVANKYTWTLFDSSKTVFDVPIKKSESRNFFFKIPIKSISYIPLNAFFALLVFYSILVAVWFYIYQQHFVLVSLVCLFNAAFSTGLLMRHPHTWKNTFDIMRVFITYYKKPKRYWQKEKRLTFIDISQTDTLSKVQLTREQELDMINRQIDELWIETLDWGFNNKSFF